MNFYFLRQILILILAINVIFSENASQPQPITLVTVHVSSNSNYEEEKKLIEPYFDEDFYKDRYADDLKKTNLSAIDHFMQHGWQGPPKTHRDPNSWFNVTLYKDRLWPCDGNPFVDFLTQPKVDLSNINQTVEIFVKDRFELFRAWMAAEAFLRLRTHKIVVRLAPSKFYTTPICFKSMIDRGLRVELTNDMEISFYKSPFIQFPAEFGINPENETSIKSPDVLKWKYEKQYISFDVDGKKFYYIKHSLPMYTNYTVEGRINPIVINIAFHESEPLHYCSFAQTETEYKLFFGRIADGYDLVFTGIKLGTENERIVPGFMEENWDNFAGTEMENKTFSLGYLLSLGAVGDTNYLKDKTRTYHMRLNFWERENEITALPRQFYVSNRAINNYSTKYQDRKMPDDSKKWIFSGQFVVAIENSRQYNYMTEKLLSCFRTLTVPIYLGCPNVTDYFDARGMLIAENIDDIIRLANTLTPETYLKMLPYLKKNKEIAEKLIKLKEHYINDFYRMQLINSQS